MQSGRNCYIKTQPDDVHCVYMCNSQGLQTQQYLQNNRFDHYASCKRSFTFYYNILPSKRFSHVQQMHPSIVFKRNAFFYLRLFQKIPATLHNTKGNIHLNVQPQTLLQKAYGKITVTICFTFLMNDRQQAAFDAKLNLKCSIPVFLNWQPHNHSNARGVYSNARWRLFCFAIEYGYQTCYFAYPLGKNLIHVESAVVQIGQKYQACRNITFTQLGSVEVTLDWFYNEQPKLIRIWSSSNRSSGVHILYSAIHNIIINVCIKKNRLHFKFDIDKNVVGQKTT